MHVVVAQFGQRGRCSFSQLSNPFDGVNERHDVRLRNRLPLGNGQRRIFVGRRKKFFAPAPIIVE